MDLFIFSDDHKLLRHGTEKHVFGSLFFGGSAFGGAVGQKIWEKRSKKLLNKMLRKIVIIVAIRRRPFPGRTDAKVQICLSNTDLVGKRQAWMTALQR